jgi:hypothetical protein
MTYDLQLSSSAFFKGPFGIAVALFLGFFGGFYEGYKEGVRVLYRAFVFGVSR